MKKVLEGNRNRERSIFLKQKTDVEESERLCSAWWPHQSQFSRPYALSDHPIWYPSWHMSQDKHKPKKREVKYRICSEVRLGKAQLLNSPRIKLEPYCG